MMPITVRPERRRPNAFHLCASRRIQAPREHVFEFLTTRIPAVYPLLSRGHERYAVEGGGALSLGARIDCRERAEAQTVHHTYEVRAIEAPSHLHLGSASQTWVRVGEKSIEGTSDTQVYYDLEDTDHGGTRLDMTIVIALPSRGKKWLATLGGTKGLWARHQGEELDRLTTLVEATRPGGPLGWRPNPAIASSP
jgi:uncharacterized protein YndB with AHSA1/START domain